MIAMQYAFSLPADYDMGIIRQRIADFGHLLDHCPQLIIKAYLYALKGEHGNDNRYAPFYLWHSSSGMSDFLTSNGFKGVSQAFGWPQVNHWLPWLVKIAPENLAEARYATLECLPIAAYSDLALLRSQQQANPLALASIVAFDPARWQLVNFHLWRQLPQQSNAQTQRYAVGHISAPLEFG
ncbi:MULTISPECIES: DUF4865 family protein [unclassified Serratia (in: enterobacteria)]|uniref:DUF4865 family protein n=1 Tax=unclassified Serratia (in: enterobacteria) TaxID=2647522 RepID=UPI0005062B49|nr:MULTISPECIES: DUF4865 family protein [unclassified Serratia (in: enterobacteria)]KFK95565.1 D-amino acid aminotransferase [Serratia sp. Ag2]KFL00421.1 D-amino acid aminotransferase [Serratia sp. Ag1]